MGVPSAVRWREITPDTSARQTRAPLLASRPNAVLLQIFILPESVRSPREYRDPGLAYHPLPHYLVHADEDMFRRYQQYLAECPDIPKPVSPRDLLGGPKTYTISSLPAMETPVKLAEYYFASSVVRNPETTRRAAHDLVMFGLAPGLSQTEFDQRLGEVFRSTPFVMDFIEYLRGEKSLRFGAVNDWIHQKCEDVPLPYRWELKENTRCLYNWLQHFVPEIAWDRPDYSQIIYWRGA
jgi:hypothetical protein